jgi:hypothetical protein
VVDRLASHRKASAKPLCGGPTGAAADRDER